MPPIKYTVVEMSEDQLEQERVVSGGLAQSVRELAEASLRTTVPPDVAADVTAEIDRLTARLREEQIPGAFGVSLTHSGVVRSHGNAVVGMRNPIAVPLDMQHSDEGRAWASFHLNALYEGPPDTVHGGVVALVLDQVLGEAAAAGGSPGMTGTLTLRYERNTPLGDLSAEAWIDRIDGIKTIVKGEMRDAEGEVTARAEGVFILPRWAREAMEKDNRKPPRFE